MIEQEGLRFRLDEKKGYDYRLYILEWYKHKFNKPKNKKRPAPEWRTSFRADRMGNWNDIHVTMQKNQTTIALNDRHQFPHVTFRGRLTNSNEERKVYFDGTNIIAYINFNPADTNLKKELAISRKAIRMAKNQHIWIKTLVCTDPNKISDT